MPFLGDFDKQKYTGKHHCVSSSHPWVQPLAQERMAVIFDAY